MMGSNVALLEIGCQRGSLLPGSSKEGDFDNYYRGLCMPIGLVTAGLYYEKEHQSSLTLCCSDQGANCTLGYRTS